MGPTKPLTRRDRQRFDDLHELGCIMIRIFFPKHMERHGPTPGEIHHVLDTGRRLADQHQATICWHPWYHRGVALPGCTEAQTRRILGPSWKLHRADFTRQFQVTDLMLLDWTDQLLFRYRQIRATHNASLQMAGGRVA